MENYKLNYDNRQLVKMYIKTNVVPYIWETLINDYYDGEINETYDSIDLMQDIWEIINGLGDVIYNYQAKKVTEAFDVDVFGISDITGERYTSYNETAHEIIYNEFYKKYANLLDI